MYLVETCAKVAAYLLCVGVALEFSHRLYWRMNKPTPLQKASIAHKSLIAAASACLPLAAAVAITAIFVSLLEGASFVSLGFRCDSNTSTFIIYGATVALVCVTTVFLLGTLAGCIKVNGCRISENHRTRFPIFIESLAAFLTGSIFEELIFRGYVFYIMQKSWGGVPAIIGSSILFSTAHLVKHRKTPVIFTLNAFIFGLLAAICRYYTGSLWLSIGLHFGWNVVSGCILGLPYSGRSFDHGVVDCDVSGPTWLTGGLYSLDAGVLGTVALIIAAIGLVAVMPVH